MTDDKLFIDSRKTESLFSRFFGVPERQKRVNGNVIDSECSGEVRKNMIVGLVLEVGYVRADLRIGRLLLKFEIYM